MKSDFTFEIKEITRHKTAELNQEFFDSVFGTDTVKDEVAFRGKVRDFLSEQYSPKSEYRFMKDVRELLIGKINNIAFADDILKRWLILSDNKTTKEQVDDDYPKMVEDMKYHFAKDELIKENKIKVKQEEIEVYARYVVKAQFAQYGMMSVSDDLLNNYVKNMLDKQESVNNLINKVQNEKLFSFIKEKITLDVQEMTLEEFGKIMEGISA
jgi:trigger factor